MCNEPCQWFFFCLSTIFKICTHARWGGCGGCGGCGVGGGDVSRVHEKWGAIKLTKPLGPSFPCLGVCVCVCVCFFVSAIAGMAIDIDMQPPILND